MRAAEPPLHRLPAGPVTAAGASMRQSTGHPHVEWVEGGVEVAVASGQRTADSGQRTADSGQRTADSGQRTADSGQRTADSGQRGRHACRRGSGPGRVRGPGRLAERGDGTAEGHYC
ncbi:hypothetical protein CH313_29005 [Streptomyces sp. TSRI0384-2]|nr:hypothetical protein CH313_29005 [Streptomyces sp. TSRI0384-2]